VNAIRGAKPWEASRHGDVGLCQAGCDEQRVVGALAEEDVDGILGDDDARRGFDEVAEEMPRLGSGVAVSDSRPQHAARLLPIRVSWRSQFTLSATAEESASMWKKSMPSEIVFSMSMRLAWCSMRLAAERG
jgi:hypothetical protein